MSHSFALRVYYEDTDLAGIVYYANYLKFIERGRSEWVRALGVDQVALKRDHGIVFAVRRVEADYLRPARFDDQVEVVSRLHAAAGSRLVLDQAVERDGATLFQASVTMVCVELGTMRPHRLPPEIAAGLGG